MSLIKSNHYAFLLHLIIMHSSLLSSSYFRVLYWLILQKVSQIAQISYSFHCSRLFISRICLIGCTLYRNALLSCSLWSKAAALLWNVKDFILVFFRRSSRIFIFYLPKALSYTVRESPLASVLNSSFANNW